MREIYFLIFSKHISLRSVEGFVKYFDINTWVYYYVDLVAFLSPTEENFYTPHCILRNGHMVNDLGGTGDTKQALTLIDRNKY